MLAELAARWPAAFAGEPRPLAIGTYARIIECWPEVARHALHLALATHTRRQAYVNRLLVAGTPRISLEGEPCGEVTEAEVERLMRQRASAG